MKTNLLKATLLLTMLFSASAAIALERCTLSLHASIFEEDGKIFRDITIRGTQVSTLEKDWESCFQKATQYASEHYSSVPLEVSGRRVAGGAVATTGFVFVKWVYDDGLIYDTNGLLTVFTKKFQPEPLDGDLRYFSNGYLFQ